MSSEDTYSDVPAWIRYPVLVVIMPFRLLWELVRVTARYIASALSWAGVYLVWLPLRWVWLTLIWVPLRAVARAIAWTWRHTVAPVHRFLRDEIWRPIAVATREVLVSLGLRRR